MTDRDWTLAPRLGPDFFVQDPLIVAEAMLGSYLVHLLPDGPRVGRVVETEAYRGQEDQACHARHGRTARTELLFGPPGRAYVYLIYGMYDLFNVTTWPEGEPSGVLVRAVEPVLGIERTTNGPGRLTRAMGITREQNGADLSTAAVFVAAGAPVSGDAVLRDARIGVDYAGDWAQRPWRFSERGNPHVSKRPRPRRAKG